MRAVAHHPAHTPYAAARQLLPSAPSRQRPFQRVEDPLQHSRQLNGHLVRRVTHELRAGPAYATRYAATMSAAAGRGSPESPALRRPPAPPGGLRKQPGQHVLDLLHRLTPPRAQCRRLQHRAPEVRAALPHPGQRMPPRQQVESEPAQRGKWRLVRPALPDRA